ncbi:MAG: type II CRISPR RNA-guided endonuclease Cas9 [Bdellovibrionales bacterium]|nr:type II CRISPR RNA-guided endonuclease Cas9 [Bdellovibrionales bacterium]
MSNKITSLKKYSNQTKNTRLALDIGTNSIGWAIYKLDKKKKPCSIIKTGVRIFSSGRNEKDYTTLNATRRQKRLERRQRDRTLQRKKFLLHLLKKYGFFPKDKDLAKELQKLNPYELRAKGLDEELELSHFGRALFHLNQRRGFKSNRKSSNDKESGVIDSSIKAVEELMEEKKVRTYGEFLWKRFQKMEESRKTPGSQQENWILARRPINFKTKDNYVVYSKRAMIKDEFNKLWNAQAKFHEKLKDEKIKEKFFKAIFFQRPLKQVIVGKCFYTGKDRIPKVSPYFQKFRILKELNNLRWINQRGESFSINKDNTEFRDHLISRLFSKKKEVKFTDIKKAFKKFFPNIEDFPRFNLDTDNRNKLEGDIASNILRKEISEWDNWSLEQQDKFVELLDGKNNHALKKGEEVLFMKEDEEVLNDLIKFSKDNNFKLNEEQLKKCIKKNLPDGHGTYSKEFIEKILPFLEKGELEHKAIQSAGFGHHSDRKYKGELANALPKYQEILKNQCVEMSLKPNKKNPFNTFRIPNPTVHVAFNQLRLLVNDIIRLYGKPSEAVIETARDLPLGVKTKNQLQSKQKENTLRNEEARKIIEDFGQENNRSNRIRYQLWKEQKYKCIYSGDPISKTALYTAQLEIDHILPYSQTLDDSYMNKVLVYKKANQGKGNQTPYEYFSSHVKQWENVLSRTKELPKGKQWRFEKEAMDLVKNDNNFLERQLNDTRYISKYAKQYMEHICPQVWTVRGQTTAIIISLIQFEEKNREDYRHHAKDALAIGLIDRSFVKKVSDIAKKIEGQDKSRLKNIRKELAKNNAILPWSEFKEDAKSSLEEIIVSHRQKTKKEGELHEETAYGGIKEIQNFSQPIDVVLYKNIIEITKEKLKNIISPKIRKDFENEFKKSNKITKEFLQDYHKKTGIRRVRLKSKETIIPIKDQFGHNYKAFMPGSNYVIKLFQDKKGKWDGKIITTFDANQNKIFLPKKNSSLMKGNLLFFEGDFWKLVKFDRNKILIFVRHFVSGNPDELRKEEKTKHLMSQKNISSLGKTKPKKVDISPAGKYKLIDFQIEKEELIKQKVTL